jgi:hypothetical protein
VGYRWIYNYSTNTEDLLNELSSVAEGTAEYKIISKISDVDSITWTVKETKDIIIHTSSFFPPYYSNTDTVKDTTEFLLVEFLEGNHRLIRIGEVEDFSVFPFTSEYQDSLIFFRYYPEATEDTVYFILTSSEETNKHLQITLKRDKGIRYVSFFL